MSPWPKITDLAARVNSGQVSAKANVDEAFKRLESASDYDAVISYTKARAYERAKVIDDQIKSGQQTGRLAGVPFIAKDNFLVFGAESTAASNILKGFEPPYQSTAVERLEAEGAICVAKANLDAFAHGTSTENSDFFVTKNPHDKSRVPGGSSGGSAAAVTLGLVPFAIGTDTGGSLRQPASFCGVIGYKPSYGVVSRSGVVAMASSTDTIGPLATSVDDTALVLDVMSGLDPYDSTTVASSDLAKLKPIKKPTVGVVKEYFDEGLQPGVKQQVEQAIDKLKQAGASVKTISLPSLPLALAVYYIICPAEVSSNLSRYDGQRYGFSAKPTGSMEDSYVRSRSQGFGAEAKRRIMIGTYVLSSGYYDAYYKKAQQVRTMLIKEFEAAFNEVDFLVGPTAPTVAFKIGEFINDPLTMYLNDILTVAANLVGLPAISLPAGLSNNLPVGFQIMAPQGQDNRLLSYARQVEELLHG